MDTETVRNIERAHFLNSGDYPINWKNIPHLLDARAAETPDKAFLTFYDDDEGIREVYTYRQFNEQVNKTANFLLSLGIRKGDKVSTVMYNHSDTAVLYFACWKIGVCVVPINAEEEAERIRFVVENSEAKALFYFKKYADKIKEIEGLIDKGRIVCVDSVDYENKINKSKPILLSDISNFSSDAHALIVYTSGTTGVPKGVLLSQYNILVDAKGITEHHELSGRDIFMCVLPIHHVNGILVTLMSPLTVSGSVVLNRKFKTEKFWKRISDERVTITSTVPTLLAFLVEKNEDIKKYNLSCLRWLIVAAGPLTVDLARKFEDTFGIKLQHGYGLSETTCFSSYMPIDLGEDDHNFWLKKNGFPSIGIAIKPNEMTIHDANGKELGQGERGEIVIRGKNVMVEYLKRDDANKETFMHGWFRSGDEGFYLLDDKGRKHFFITGRIKELIIRGGTNISPLEIDEVLNSIPGVKRAVCVGFENKWYGEEVGACINLNDGTPALAEEILAHCSRRLPFFKRPKVVLFVDDIPVTSTGKYQRSKMKHLFEKYKDTQFRDESKVNNRNATG